MTKFQFDRKNPLKPNVHFDGHVWWATAYDINGNYHCELKFNHADALEQAHEYAAMNRAAQALHQMGEAA